jgi:hypothetical protein
MGVFVEETLTCVSPFATLRIGWSCVTAVLTKFQYKTNDFLSLSVTSSFTSRLLGNRRPVEMETKSLNGASNPNRGLRKMLALMATDR